MDEPLPFEFLTATAKKNRRRSSLSVGRWRKSLPGPAMPEFHAQVPCDMAQTGRLKLVVGHCLKYGLERAEQRSGENEFSDHATRCISEFMDATEWRLGTACARECNPTNDMNRELVTKHLAARERLLEEKRAWENIIAHTEVRGVGLIHKKNCAFNSKKARDDTKEACGAHLPQELKDLLRADIGSQLQEQRTSIQVSVQQLHQTAKTIDALLQSLQGYVDHMYIDDQPKDRATATRPGTENLEPLIDMDETPRRVIMRLGML